MAEFSNTAIMEGPFEVAFRALHNTQAERPEHIVESEAKYYASRSGSVHFVSSTNTSSVKFDVVPGDDRNAVRESDVNTRFSLVVVDVDRILGHLLRNAATSSLEQPHGGPKIAIPWLDDYMRHHPRQPIVHPFGRRTEEVATDDQVAAVLAAAPLSDTPSSRRRGFRGRR